MKIDSAHHRWWQISEVVFGIPFLTAIVLQWLVPLRLPRGVFAIFTILAGAAVGCFGVILIVLTRREFAKAGQPTDPGHPTTRMITTGVFSYSRNPIYLGAACFLAGVALVFNLPWGLIFLVPSLLACHYILIGPEEKYLFAKFGDEYRGYTASVSRWIGRRRTPW